MKHIVNVSGGKDSTAMLLMMLEKGMPVDYIVFADTGKDFPKMLDHLDKLEAYIKERYNAPAITRLKAPVSFDYLMFDHIKTKGKNKGKCGYGWATMGARWCTKALKTQILNRFARSLKDDYVHYIGIAADEPERLNNEPHKAYPLADWNITEAQALQYCYDAGFDWDGLYRHFKRVSCWCCPLKSLDELRTLWKHYPQLWAELKEMDGKAYNQFKHNCSVQMLEERFIQEERTAAVVAEYIKQFASATDSEIIAYHKAILKESQNKTDPPEQRQLNRACAAALKTKLLQRGLLQLKGGKRRGS